MKPLGTSELLKSACNRPIPDARCHGTHCSFPIRKKQKSCIKVNFQNKLISESQVDFFSGDPRLLRKLGPVAAAGARLGFRSQSQVTERRGQRLGGELRLRDG